MRCLIGQFQREQKNAKSETATGADEVYYSKWFALRLAYVVVSRIRYVTVRNRNGFYNFINFLT